MKTRTILILLAATMLCGCHAITAGSGNIVSEERAVEDFSAIHYGGSANIDVRHGDSCTVVIHCDDNLLENIQTTVEGEKLLIRHKGFVRWTEMRIEVTTPNLDSFLLSGSGSGSVSDIETDSLHVTLAGSGGMNINNLTSESLKVDLSGSGGISANGTASDVAVMVAGSGSASMGELKALRANATLSGSGSINVYATEKLDAVLSGSGSIVCAGDPQHKTTVDTGSGNIRVNGR